MSSALAFLESPRCHARSKRTGQQCQAPAVTGWKVCRYHGAGGGAPKGERNGNFKTGNYTLEARAERCATAALLKQAKELLASL